MPLKLSYLFQFHYELCIYLSSLQMPAKTNYRDKTNTFHFVDTQPLTAEHKHKKETQSNWNQCCSHLINGV